MYSGEMKFRPLLAEKVNLETLEYPVYASPKYDGFRCLIGVGGRPISRNLKPIPNSFVFGKLQELKLPRFDGELLTYTNGKLDDFNTVQSKLSSRSGMPEFRYMVFDYLSSPQEAFHRRDASVDAWFQAHPEVRKYSEHVRQTLIHCEEDLLAYEAVCLSQGWEGVMVRSVQGRYKFGRSTMKEGILLKLKRFFDDEAVVVTAHELMHNGNEATVNELGYQERSSHKANMQGMDTLGKLTVRWGEVEFDIGTGFTESQRRQVWMWGSEVVGKTLTFKYQSLGPNGKPRFPVFLGFRHDV